MKIIHILLMVCLWQKQADCSRLRLDLDLEGNDPVVDLPSTTVAPSTTSTPSTTLSTDMTTSTTPGDGTSVTTTPRTDPTTLPPMSNNGGKVYMTSGAMLRISSPNFGTGNYFNSDTTTWKFIANQCFLEVACPCVDIPSSYGCLGDYLKITNVIETSMRFCGGNRPGSPVRPGTDSVFVRFRSNLRETATGFVCFVSCTGPGQEFPTYPDIKCPTKK